MCTHVRHARLFAHFTGHDHGRRRLLQAGESDVRDKATFMGSVYGGGYNAFGGTLGCFHWGC